MSYEDIQAAALRIAPFVRRTPPIKLDPRAQFAGRGEVECRLQALEHGDTLVERPGGLLELSLGNVKLGKRHAAAGRFGPSRIAR